jgi:hypothetical protein
VEVHVAGHIDQLNRKTEESNATNAVEVHVAGHIDYINRKTEESNATNAVGVHVFCLLTLVWASLSTA